ncbi:MAG: DUF268 domain-containing protein [Acidobacteria bacterium]|nr:DUF268 domain-containing protein [Acidobacteriota bacterium]
MRAVPGSVIAYMFLRRIINAGRVTFEFRRYSRLAREAGVPLVPQWGERMFFLDNRTVETPFDRHYVYHTAWATRQLARLRPAEHVDVSSSVYFVALASAIAPIRHLDYRPPALFLDNLKCEEGDLMALPLKDGSVASLSCMHVIEHIGLGRYGEPIDPLADAKACRELSRVLAPSGILLFVTPVGRARTRFNAHRIYSFAMVKGLFPRLQLLEWTLIPDDATQGLLPNMAPELVDEQSYACGCFAFRKPEHSHS